jgi:diguanylate cyclase (GGDEF)-like protein
MVAWIATETFRHPRDLFSVTLLVWAAAITVVDLLPLPMSSDKHFSLSFPLQLAVALVYTPWLAALVAILGTSDRREFRREIAPLKAVFIRSQIAASVAAEGFIFHSLSSLHGVWYVVGAAVLVATVAGYSVNVALVALYERFRGAPSIGSVVRDMHRGIFGELILSYTGLALFGVILASFFAHNQAFLALIVFVAPVAFARQMFAKTHSLKLAKDELEFRQREMEYQTRHDALTDLPNRLLFAERLAKELDAGSNARVAVMVMDLDQFKEVNDALGHHYGDLLLREVAARLAGAVREQDMVARLGGDEFSVLMPNVDGPDAITLVTERLTATLTRPVELEGMMFEVSASMGIALSPDHGDDIETLLRRADVAMYAAKSSHSRYELYSPTLETTGAANLALIGEVRPALERSQFVLHYQPQADLSTGRVTSAEALLRWKHPQRGLIMPDSFIRLTERTVLLRPLTMFVIDEALRQARTWRDKGIDLTIAVNLSPHSLLDTELPGQVDSLLRKWNLPSSALQLEITEGSLTGDSVRSMQVIHRLASVGVGLSIDDFGTGYSSLAYLKRLPVNEIKVDRSFVLNMTSDVNDATIVRATVDLSHNLGLRVVAEGVEDTETWAKLAELHCDLAQGYLLGRPAPADDFERWLIERAGSLDDDIREPAAAPAPLA